MKRKVREGVVWLEFEIFSSYPEIQHAIILRHGGFSQGSFSSMNFSHSTGDEKSKILSNYDKLKNLFNFSDLIQMQQVHGKEVHIAHRPGEILIGDGVVTQQKELPLLITHADCQAALFYDPVQRVIAATHSGWKGNVQNIYAETVAKMENHFGSRAKNLRVGVSPSLGPFHAEFIHYQKELPQSFWQFQTKPFHFDLWKISQMQLIEAGIPADQIEIASLCTYGNPEDFFSYRRCKIRGGHASFIALRNLEISHL